jgi:hypothetical protein
VATENSLPGHATELWELVVAYLKQETIEPIKDLGRYIAWGVAGSVIMGIGLPLLVLGVLRVLQSETGEHFTGNLTWVPYAGAFGFSLILLGLAGMGFARNKERKR